MSDWQAGDLALCVKVGRWSYTKTGSPCLVPGPRAGEVLTVSATWVGLEGERLLAFDGYPLPPMRSGLPRGWWASRFRKVTPPAADEFDRETIALMTSTPAKVPAQVDTHAKRGDAKQAPSARMGSAVRDSECAQIAHPSQDTAP